MRLPAEELRKIAAEWRAARRVYAIYMEISERLGLNLEACAELESPIDRSEPEALASVNAWMDAAETKIAPHHLRMHCQTTLVGEPALRALIGRVLRKEKKEEADRDKIDFLMVQYFAQCAPMKAHRDDVKHAEVAAVLEIVLGEVDAAPPAWLEPLGKSIDRLRACKTLREMLDDKLLSDGRKIKVGANGRYFTPPVLIAFTRYNFITRRTFFRLVLTELDLLRIDLAKLEKAGATTIDCRAAKLGDKESITRLRELVNDWKHPFRAEYSEGLSFETLVAVRDAATKALSSVPAKPVEKAAAAATAHVAVAGAPKLPTSVPTSIATPHKTAAGLAAGMQKPLAAGPQKVPTPASPARPAQVGAASGAKGTATAPAAVKPTNEFNVEQEFKAVCAQLTDALTHSASPENTMTRITLGTQRLVLSSWEVRGFVQPNETFSSAMQSGVAARVLVERELEKAKAGRGLDHMPALVKFAHTQAAIMQEHVAQARDARDIDAAVTLAATSKRLTQLLQEAEKLTTAGPK